MVFFAFPSSCGDPEARLPGLEGALASLALGLQVPWRWEVGPPWLNLLGVWKRLQVLIYLLLSGDLTRIIETGNTSTSFARKKARDNKSG